jgi:hypothetical protein
MNIYLAYIINSTGIRMNQDKFTTLCVTLAFNEQAIRVALTEQGWSLDTEFGISMIEAVNMAFARYNFDREQYA